MNKSISDPLTFLDYQEAADALAFYPDRGQNLTYPVLGLAGEAGEVCEKLKKAIRDSKGAIDLAEMKKELGDVLWYINAVSYELGLTLEEIAEANLLKLQSRRARGTQSGSGDNR